jgi:protoporphyrinogen oxidase
LEQKLFENGVEIRDRTEVREIIKNGNGVKCNAGGNTVEYDAVIITLPSNGIPALVPGLTEHEKKRLFSVTYEGVICPALLFKKPLAGYYVTNITDAHPSFTGVIEMTALVDRKYFGGHSLIYLPRYLASDDPIWEKEDNEIMELFLSALLGLYPGYQREDVLASTVSRARNVMPVLTLHYSTQVLPSSMTSIGSLFIVNSSQVAGGTMNMDEIISLAVRKSDEIAQMIRRR